jgi:predicted O-linked N-acetylglucosamine transferase (SPINDLY family)
LVSDAVTIPPEHEEHHTERILRLPCAVGFDSRPPWPEVASPPAERNGYVTFGYLGRGYKLNEQTLSAWAEILRRLPTARLILKDAPPVLREWLLSAFSALGVAPERISIRGTTTRMLHLATYNEIDVHLDPFPHGGGITTLDACLMGVPTVTLLGDYPSGRLSASILQTVGRPFGIRVTVPGYIDYACGFTDATPSVHGRQGLRDELLDSVLCNERLYASAAEGAYRQVWREWCER